MLRLINPPPLAANNSQVFKFNFLSLHHVTHCRSQDYRPPFPQQGVNQSLLERNSSSAAPPLQFILSRELSHKVSPGPSWDSPVTPSTSTWDSTWDSPVTPAGSSTSYPITFREHILRLSLSPLIAPSISSPFLVQPIARKTSFNQHFGEPRIRIQ